jgi:Protein of unknown function (DUF3421)
MGPPNRRRSIDSSSSSTSSPSPNMNDQSLQSKKKHAFDKGESHSDNNSSGGAQASRTEKAGSTAPPLPLPLSPPHDPPPTYVPSTSTTTTSKSFATPTLNVDQVPPSGFRIPLSTQGSEFPSIDKTRAAPFTDGDGRSPVFIGSALMQYSVHPCKVAPHLAPPSACRVPYGGLEHAHHGRYDLLPFIPERMEFVQTSHGRIPPARRPVKGGFENNGAELYHAAAIIDGVRVPGKTGVHLVCNHPSRGPTSARGFCPFTEQDINSCSFLSGRLQRRVWWQGTCCE